jgi:hypothetical protein
MSLHFDDAHYFFAALRRQRNRHSPGQLLEIFPVIDLRLINNKSSPIAVLFARPARIGRLIGGDRAGCSLKWRRKERRDNKYAVKQRNIRQFHNCGGGPRLSWHAVGAVGNRTLGQYAPARGFFSRVRIFTVDTRRSGTPTIPPRSETVRSAGHVEPVGGSPVRAYRAD